MTHGTPGFPRTADSHPQPVPMSFRPALIRVRHRPLRARTGRLRRPGAHPAPSRGGGMELSDALREPAASGTVHAVVFDGPRHDTGDKADHLRTVVPMACARPCGRWSARPAPGRTSVPNSAAGSRSSWRHRRTVRSTAAPGPGAGSGAGQPGTIGRGEHRWTGDPGEADGENTAGQLIRAGRAAAGGRSPARLPGQSCWLGRRVHTTCISPVTAPSARRISIVTGNSGRLPASSSATTSAAGRPRVAVAVTAPIASFL